MRRSLSSFSTSERCSSINPIPSSLRRNDSPTHNDEPPPPSTMDPKHSNVTSSLGSRSVYRHRNPHCGRVSSVHTLTRIPCMKSIPLVTGRTGSFGVRFGAHYTPRSFRLSPISLRFPRRTLIQVGVVHHQVTHPFCGLRVCSKARWEEDKSLDVLVPND